MIDINNLCQYCFSEAEKTAAFCPHCGKNPSQIPERGSRCLPQYTILAGRYLVGRVLGEGGFGITYLAMDLLQEKRVAVKEYFPVDLAARDSSSEKPNDILVTAGETAIHFRNGMRRFESEAMTLRKLELLPGIVSVLDFFQENNTAYLVMEYIEGGNLKGYLKSYTEKNGTTLPYDQALALMRPVLASLQKIHSAGIIHRDISPENILMDSNGKLVLIDFGSSKTNLASRENRSMTVMVKHGYAPEEQYRTHGDQGPWTDIYAVSATLYHMISGILPEDAIERLIDDKLTPLKNMPLSHPIPAVYSDIIQKGMQSRAKDRYQSMEEMIADLDKADRTIQEQQQKAEEARKKAEAEKAAAIAAAEAARKKTAAEEEKKAAEAARTHAQKEEEKKQETDTKPEKKRTGIIIGVAVIAAIVVLALLLGPLRPRHHASASSSSEEAIEAVDDSIKVNKEDREYIIEFLKRMQEESGTPSEENIDNLADISDTGFAAVTTAIILPIAGKYINEGQPLYAAILYSRLNEEVRVGSGGPTNEQIVELWQKNSVCNDIDYRTQRLAAINADGTVRALCSPAGTEDYSEVANWNNIVSIEFAKMGGQLYGLKSNGTIVCNRFNNEKFGELVDVIGLAAVTNGYMAALCADGSVYFDKQGEAFDCFAKADTHGIDQVWHDIRYIAGGYKTLTGVRQDGSLVEVYFEQEGETYNIQEVAELTHFQEEKITKIVNDGAYITVLTDQGLVHVLEDPIKESGHSGYLWMTADDITRIEAATDIVDIEPAIILHADGTVEGFGTAWYVAEGWQSISDISWNRNYEFAIQADGTIRYYDPEIFIEEYWGDRFPKGLSKVDDYTYIDNATGEQFQIAEDELEAFERDLLSDRDLAEAVNWTGLRTRTWHTALSKETSAMINEEEFSPHATEWEIKDDGSGTFVGYVNGYNAEEMRVFVEFSPAGEITKVEVDSSSETEGIGTLVSEPAFTDNFIGRSAEIDYSEIDAVSGATISSKVVLSVVNLAIETYTTARMEYLGY